MSGYKRFVVVEYLCKRCGVTGFIELRRDPWRKCDFDDIRLGYALLDHSRRTKGKCGEISGKQLCFSTRWHWTQQEFDKQVEQLRRTV